MEKQENFYGILEYNQKYQLENNCFKNNNNIYDDGICLDWLTTSKCKHINCRFNKNYQLNPQPCKFGLTCKSKNKDCIYIHPDELKLEYFSRLNLFDKLNDIKNNNLSLILKDIMELFNKHNSKLNYISSKLDNIDYLINKKINEYIYNNNNKLSEIINNNNKLYNILRQKEEDF